MIFNKVIDKLETSPKSLFIIDGFGAILSAFLLGFVLVKLERYFGIPTSVLHFLAIIPIFFVFYDLFCFQKSIHQLAPLLKGIAGLNLSYSCLSLGLAIFHIHSISILGWIYILIEILILIILAKIEFSVANRIIKLNSSNKGNTL